MRVVCGRTHLTVLKFEEYFGGNMSYCFLSLQMQRVYSFERAR